MPSRHKQKRIMLGLDEITYSKLVELAEKDHRPVANLAAALLSNAIKDLTQDQGKHFSE
jgi:hypothetical protein